MILTRANAEFRLLRRIGRVLSAAGLDGEHDDGSNQDLVDPLAFAIESLGGSIADPEAITDGDLGSVDNAAGVLDLAELRALENAAQNYILVDITRDGTTHRDNQLGERLDAMIAAKRARIAVLYPSLGAASLSAGTLSLGIDAVCDE